MRLMLLPIGFQNTKNSVDGDFAINLVLLFYENNNSNCCQ